MFELRYDSENSGGYITSSGYEEYSYDYYDVYLNNKPVYTEPEPDTFEPSILSLAINKEEKYIEIVNASEHVFYTIGEIKRQELYNLIMSLVDELNIRDYSIFVVKDPWDNNDIMTNELANVLNNIDFDIKTITI